jgi:hypothetical protein
MRWWEVLMLAAVLAFVLAGCGGGDDDDDDGGPMLEPAIPGYVARPSVRQSSRFQTPAVKPRSSS